MNTKSQPEQKKIEMVNQEIVLCTGAGGPEFWNMLPEPEPEPEFVHLR